MAKMTLKGAAKHSVRGWGAVLAGGILMTTLAMLDLPRDGALGSATATTSSTSTADSPTGCRLQVTSATLFVRTGPSVDTGVLETINQGTVVDGTTEVTDGFRKLAGNRWAANEYLVPVQGSAC